MAHALYAWTFHFEGVKRLCKLPDKRVATASTPSMAAVIKAILKQENAGEKKSYERAKKIIATKKKIVAESVAQCHLEWAQRRLESPQYTYTAEDVYPVDMHFMTDLAAILPNAGDEQWFKNNLRRVRAAYGIDADESDTYLVVEE